MLTPRHRIPFALTLIGMIGLTSPEQGGCSRRSEAETHCRIPATQAPSNTGSLGNGDRTIEVVNAEGSELHIRLLDASGCPALRGILVIGALGSGRFRVSPGTYQMRFRTESTGTVYEGRIFTLGENHRGIRITLRYGHGTDGTPVSRTGGAL